MRRVELANEELTENWKPFDVPLTSVTDKDLKAVVGSFGWIVTWSSNGVVEGRPKTFVIEIRDVSYRL
jgi:hypothetical protein